VEGGRYFLGDIVEIERIDIYDFKVTISEIEFKVIRKITDESGHSIEHELGRIICIGLDEVTNS